MAKQFFIGSSLFFLGLLLLWGVYSMFFSVKKVAETKNPEPVSTEIPTETPTVSKVIRAVIDAPVLSPVISSSGKGGILYIDKNTNSLQRFDLATQTKEVLVQEPLTSPINAIWSKSGEFVFAKELRSNETSLRLFHIGSTDAPVSLKWGTRFLIWDELENKILYTFRDDAGNITLNIALPNGTQWKELAKLPSTPVFLQAIPKSPLVSFWGKPANAYISELKSVNLTSGELKTIFAGKYGADYAWSPDGEKVLMSWAPEKNGSRMALSLINKNGGEYTDLNFPTMVKKCVWSSDSITVYCSLPGSLPQGAILPNDYMNQVFMSNDTFWKVDTKTGKSERIVPLEDMTASYDASELFLSPDETELFFVNRKDYKLYSIEL